MPPLRDIALAALLIVLPCTKVVAAPHRALTTTELVDFCMSTTMAEAESEAGALGWKRMDDTVNDDWREGFLSMSGGTVDIITWQHSDNATEGLSFWIAVNESGLRVCDYSTKTPTGLLDSLKQQFGTPSSVLNHDFGEVVFWTRGAMEVSFSRVDSSASVTISRKF